MDLAVSTKALKDVFSFPFRDPDWRNKLLIGCAMTIASMFVPIVPWLAVSGYGARLIRAGANNEDAARLPNWDDWGELFLDGLRLLGAGILINLPVIIIMGGGFLLYMIGVFSIAGPSDNLSGGQAAFMILSMLIMFLSMGLGTLLWIAIMLFSPAVLAHVAVQRRFAALFDVKGWWRILRANFGGFLIALVLFMSLYTVLMFAFNILYFTLILCFLAPLLVMPVAYYGGLIYFRLTGQAYGEALEKLAQPAAPAAPDLAAPLPAEG